MKNLIYILIVGLFVAGALIPAKTHIKTRQQHAPQITHQTTDYQKAIATHHRHTIKLPW